jgi:hypothetical protein
VTRTVAVGLALSAALALTPAAAAKELKVLSEKTVTGLGHVESVGYDPKGKVFYASDFGAALKPADKDGQGKIAKISLDGKILDAAFLPAKGQVLNKPKGNIIKGNRLWVTDIDSVWVFDLKTKKGKKLALPGASFANDPAIIGNTLYVSDNRADKLFSVEPADFLNKDPKVTTVLDGKGVNANGVAAGKGGTLLMAGFAGKDKPRGIYAMKPGGKPELISKPIGMLDGIYQMKNGDLLVTDWVSGSLFQWNKKMGMKKLATGFKGPADFAVAPNAKGYLVAVPDLVKAEIRFIQLGK